MAPPIPLIPLSNLSNEVNTLPSGKPRRPPITLQDCVLKELVQFKCNVEDSRIGRSEKVVFCEPVVRLIRECANGVHVETTAWERWNATLERERAKKV